VSGTTKDPCSSLVLELPRFFASLRMTGSETQEERRGSTVNSSCERTWPLYARPRSLVSRTGRTCYRLAWGEKVSGTFSFTTVVSLHALLELVQPAAFGAESK
jgi:hypothetical protein